MILKQLLYCGIMLFSDVLKIQGKINIRTADMPFTFIPKKKVGNPATNQHDIVTILTQNSHYLDHYRKTDFDLSFLIIVFRYHFFLILFSNRNSAASSPLSLNFLRSRYNWISETIHVSLIF